MNQPSTISILDAASRFDDWECIFGRAHMKPPKLSADYRSLIPANVLIVGSEAALPSPEKFNPQHLPPTQRFLVSSHQLCQAGVARQLIEYCQSTETPLGIIDTHRFQPALQEAHNTIAAGKLGRPALLRIHRWSSAKPAARRWLIADIDWALELFNATPTEILALATTDSEHLQVQLGFANDGICLLEYASALPSENSYNAVTVIGSQGAVYLDDQHNSHLLMDKAGAQLLRSESSLSHRVTELQHAIDSNGTTNMLDVGRLRNIHTVLDAMESSLDRQEVCLLSGSHE